jgi:hypothetical protein
VFGKSAEIKQELRIDRLYDRPFALIGCGVTLRDPSSCNGVALLHITEGAGSPVHPAGTKTTLYVLDVAVRGSESAPGVVVEGDGRRLEEIRTHNNLIGVKLLGDDNVLRHSAIHLSTADGLVVDGNRNVIEATDVTSAGGHGIRVTGNRNKLIGNLAGGQLTGNAGDGINVRGAGNVLRRNEAYGNVGDGFDVSGGRAAAPNVLKANTAGGPYLGNGGNGIVLGGTGGGAGDPVEVENNKTFGNYLAGVKVLGQGHQLRGNVSGGTGLKSNGGCEFEVTAGNLNATGNLAGSTGVLGASGTAFPSSCINTSF